MFHLSDIDFIVRSVSADPLDPNDALCKIDCYDQTVIVAFDVEDNSFGVGNARGCVESFDFGGILPMCIAGASWLSRPPPPKLPPLVAHVSREHHLVDLVGAVNEPRLAGVAIDPFQDRILGVAARTVELDRGV